MAIACADGVHLLAIAAGEPEHPAVRGYAPHIWCAVGDFPLAGHPARGEVDYRYAAFLAVGNIEYFGVAAGVEAMRTLAGRQKSENAQACAIDQMDSVGLHIGDITSLAVW